MQIEHTAKDSAEQIRHTAKEGAEQIRHAAEEVKHRLAPAPKYTFLQRMGRPFANFWDRLLGRVRRLFAIFSTFS